MPDFVLNEMEIGYVNLDSRPDRLEHIERELARVQLSGTRQRGMLPSEYRGDPSLVEVMRNRTPGAIGCHYSQREIICRGIRSGSNVMVLEDDAVFCNDLHERAETIRSFLSGRQWDVFSLGATFHVNPPVWHKDDLGRDVECTEHPNIMRTYGIWSTYAWVINGDSAQKIVNLLDAHVKTSIGIDYLMIQIQPQLQCYCFVPGCAKQMDSRSDIGTGVTYFSHFDKLGPYWWQRRAADFDPSTFNWAEAKHAS